MYEGVRSRGIRRRHCWGDSDLRVTAWWSSGLGLEGKKPSKRMSDPLNKRPFWFIGDPQDGTTKRAPCACTVEAFFWSGGLCFFFVISIWTVRTGGPVVDFYSGMDLTLGLLKWWGGGIFDFGSTTIPNQIWPRSNPGPILIDKW